MNSQAVPLNDASSLPMHVCGICQKPFLRENSFNRHVLYCRRTQNRPRSRIRSCRGCIKAKQKCNFQAPCSRCICRGVECIYDRVIEVATEGAQSANTETAIMTAPTTRDQPGNTTNNTRLPPDTLSVLKDSTIGVNWDLDVPLPDILWPPSKDTTPQMEQPSYASSLRKGGTTDTFIDELLGFHDNERADAALDCPWPTQTTAVELVPGRYKSTRSDANATCDFLSPIPVSNPVTKFTANMIMQTLCSFPHMMLRRETFPPFIHGHWSLPADAMDPALPQPLLTCMGLSHVFASTNLETRHFLWRAIQEEQRALSEYARQQRLTKKEHLAAVQVLLIYMMMRVVDDSKIEPGLNLELVTTYQELCDNFKSRCNEPFYHNERLHPSWDWEEWIFAESRRRTAIIWLLVTQLVHIKIGVPCDTFESFRDIPLSSPKGLWEARTREEWQAEYLVYQAMPRTELEVVGDLVDATKQNNIAADKKKLHAWNATADNLGVLLNLSATMI